MTKNTRMRPLTIGQVQINNSFSNQNYFPYSVGLLQAYVEKHAPPDAFGFLLPLYKRLPVSQAVAHLESADVVAFSTYVWNIRISLEIARRLKAHNPAVCIVFGGPQVPDRPEAFLREHPFIDLACHGEGERAFLQLLEQRRHAASLEAVDWREVPSLTWRDGKRLVTNPRAARLKTLDEIPSPYLEGVFEPLIAANPDETWLALWETNRGCPFSCTFCDWGSAVAAKVYPFDLTRLHGELDWFAAHRTEFIFCCDANFGILPRDIEIATYAAKLKAERGYPQALSVQNTKNATERAYEVQSILSRSGLNKGVTLSLQSVDPGTLEKIKRKNISSDSYRELQRRFTRDRVETYSDLILGLPGETYASFTEGVSAVIEQGQHNRIQFNNLTILPNAEMADPAYRAAHGLETVETKIINIHGTLVADDDEVHESQELVIATATLPRDDWRRARAFSWMTALLHFDKVLQIPLVLAHELGGLSYRELILQFTDGDLSEAPVLEGVRRFFIETAASIQAGGTEYVPAPQWLNIFWPADEHALIELVFENRLDAFYAEAERVLTRALASSATPLPPGALHDAITLNQALLKRPFETADCVIEVGYDLLAWHRAKVVGDEATLTPSPTRYHIDRTSERWTTWDDWCRQVIWYGNKKGAYLYGNCVTTREIAGHY